MDRKTRFRDWAGLFFICLALVIVTTDLSVVDAVLPEIVGAFDITGHLASFVISIYMLVSACLLIPAGKLADRIGARRVFALGMFVFAAGSLVCGLTPDYTIFLAGRFVQASGYALTFPAALAMVNMRFPHGAPRTLAFAIVALSIGAALGAGPVVGGIIAKAGDWNWVFISNAPLALVAGIGCVAVLPTHPTRRDEKGFDAVGLVLLIAGQVMLFGGLQIASRAGWLLAKPGFTLFGVVWPLPVSPAFLFILGSLVLAYLFLRTERGRERRGRSVIVEVSIFENRKFSWAFVAAGAMTAGVFGFLYLLPLFVEYVLEENLLGSLVATLGLGMVVGGLVSSPLLSRFGAARVTFVAMVLQFAAPFTAAFFLHYPMSPILFAPGLFLQGAGWSLAYAVLQNTMLSNVRTELAAMASGTGLMGRLLAGAITTALIASILLFTTTMATRNLDMSSLTSEQAGEIRQAYEFNSVLKLPVTSGKATIADLRGEAHLRDIIGEVKDDMVFAIRLGLLVIAAINLLGLLSARQIWRKRPREAPDAAGDAA